MTPEEARNRLAREAVVRHQDTSLSERPFWFRFDVRAQPDEAVTIDLL